MHYILLHDLLHKPHQDRRDFRACRVALRGEGRGGSAVDESGADSPLHGFLRPAADARSVRVAVEGGKCGNVEARGGKAFRGEAH